MIVIKNLEIGSFQAQYKIRLLMDESRVAQMFDTCDCFHLLFYYIIITSNGSIPFLNFIIKFFK